MKTGVDNDLISVLTEAINAAGRAKVMRALKSLGDTRHLSRSRSDVGSPSVLSPPNGMM